MTVTFSVPKLNEHYEGAYSDRERAWRDVCAIDKTDHIVALLSGQKAAVERVLEVGCGTGAVLRRLASAGIGSLHQGVDVIDPSRHTGGSERDSGITLGTYDGSRLPFPDRSFDLVYATHVLEHVPDERGFLKELARVASRWLYLEVPCELHLRTSQRALQESLDIGHINAYTPEAFALTLATSGLEVVSLKSFDHSLAVHGFWSNPVHGVIKHVVRKAALGLNEKLATRLFTYHTGALCRVAP